jgi:hypothetical protein
MRKEIVQRIKQRYKQPVIEMGGGFLNSAVGGFKTMRDELVRIGFGPFEVGLPYSRVSDSLHGPQGY